jgi:hypothetical protein
VRFAQFARLVRFTLLAAWLARFTRFTRIALLAWFVAAVAGRLNATERAAELVNLTFVGELLAFGEFDEFQNFVQLIRHLLERLGNLRGEFDGLADGGNVGGAEIGGLGVRWSWIRATRFLNAWRRRTGRNWSGFARLAGFAARSFDRCIFTWSGGRSFGLLVGRGRNFCFVPAVVRSRSFV